MLTKKELIDVFEKGCKDPQDFRIGIESEQFIFKDIKHTPKRVRYDEPQGIRHILLFFEKFGYEPLIENSHVIGMSHPSLKSQLSIEPGGQFEFATAPLLSIEEVIQQHERYFEHIQDVERTFDVRFLAKGFDPYSTRDDVPWMPKKRYDIMKAYMAKVGSLGHDMMKRTCTVQANLDYKDEQDMIKKMRVAMCLQPFISAYFANSSMVEGSITPFQTYRLYTWQHTDADRCGILPIVFDEGFGFERYVDYLLDVPMYFIKRDHAYVDMTGQSFRQFMEHATLQDFEDHMTTVFPEVRLKQYLEMRGADVGPLSHIIHFSNFWYTLFYVSDHLDFVYNRVKNWTYEEVNDLYRQVPKRGMDATFQDKPLSFWFNHIFFHEDFSTCLNVQVS